MAKVRKFVAYRRLERPYTRKSKFRKKNYVRATPNTRVVRFNMGDSKKSYFHTLGLISKQDIQIRHNAIESSRLAANRRLEKEVGVGNYFFQIRMFPHHILRENPLAAGAGADRMSTGMKRSFGKPIGTAAQVRENQQIFIVNVPEESLVTARNALKVAIHKLPGKYQIIESKIIAE